VLLHLWSLGIEEQFYIAWPLLVWLAYRLGFPRLALLGVSLGASFFLCVAESRIDVAYAYFSLGTRSWELLGNPPKNGGRRK
jgi:peptidoglycan/LPS O-acetylase OafA/YrhL